MQNCKCLPISQSEKRIKFELIGNNVLVEQRLRHDLRLLSVTKI